MTEYRIMRIDSRTVVNHGIRKLPNQATRNLERMFAIFWSDALISRGCHHTELARHHAAKARRLVADHAAVVPFSAESGRRYIEASR